MNILHLIIVLVSVGIVLTPVQSGAEVASSVAVLPIPTNAVGRLYLNGEMSFWTPDRGFLKSLREKEDEDAEAEERGKPE